MSDAVLSPTMAAWSAGQPSRSMAISKEGPFRLADGDRSGASRHGDRLGQRAAAGIELAGPDREPRIEIDREKRGSRLRPPARRPGGDRS